MGAKGGQVVGLNQIKDNNYAISEPTPERLKSLMFSIRSYGQIAPIVVRSYDNLAYEVIKGSTIVRALKELGIDQVMITNKGAIEPHQAKIMYIALKNTMDTDYIKTSDLVDELVEEYGLVHVVDNSGMDKQEIQEIQRIRSFEWEKYLQSGDTNQASLF